jgi:vesicle-fusing ATPase
MGNHFATNIIILNMMNVICKPRGSNKTIMSDLVINQLLLRIDGVDSLNISLLIGMINHTDMIDNAIIHSVRLDIHIQIGLPFHKGRLKILGIHTKSMSNSNHISHMVIVASKNY